MKRAFLYVLFLLATAAMASFANASAISDTLAVSDSNSTCTGTLRSTILEDGKGPESSAKVQCLYKATFGMEGPTGSDLVQSSLHVNMKSDKGGDGKDAGEKDVITVQITAVSLPDGLPVSDTLTVTVKDTAGAYNFTQTVSIPELSNGKDMGQATIDFPVGFRVWAKDGGDSINLSGSVRLISYADKGDTGGETYTNTITIVAGSDIPEPSSLVLLGSGLLGVAGIGRRFWRR